MYGKLTYGHKQGWKQTGWRYRLAVTQRSWLWQQKWQTLDLVSEAAPRIGSCLDRSFRDCCCHLRQQVGGWVDGWIHGGMNLYPRRHESVSTSLLDGINPLARSTLSCLLLGTQLSVISCFPLPSYSSCGSAHIEIYFQEINCCQSLAVGSFRIRLSIQAKTKYYLDIPQPMTEHRSGTRALPCTYAGFFYEHSSWSCTTV